MDIVGYILLGLCWVIAAPIILLIVAVTCMFIWRFVNMLYVVFRDGFGYWLHGKDGWNSSQTKEGVSGICRKRLIPSMLAGLAVLVCVILFYALWF